MRQQSRKELVECAARVASGETIASVGRSVNVSPEALSARMQEAGLYRPRRCIDTYAWAEAARAEMRAGLDLFQVSEKCGLTPSVVAGRLRKQAEQTVIIAPGVTLRPVAADVWALQVGGGDVARYEGTREHAVARAHALVARVEGEP